MSDPDLLDPWATVDATTLVPRPCTVAAVKVVQGPDLGKTLSFEVAITVGVSPHCDLQLSDSTVSRRHAIVEPFLHGVRVRDQGSRNGTWVDNCSLMDAVVAPGSRFRMGNSWLEVDHDASQTAGPSQPALDEDGPTQFGRFIGSSPPARRLYAALNRVAPTDATVLLEGESGTGKELLAEAIHEYSPRADQPFVVVDCGAITETLIEAELFGHEKGAFTGAGESRVGAFERADKGTVFLDEIGELPLSMQTRLLRVLDRRQVARVGGGQRVDIDVRVIAATNRNLEQEVEASRFRLDLYHRLAVVLVRVPALHERSGDIALLANDFLRQLGAPASTLGPERLTRLAEQRWPGNTRELRNYVERVVLLGEAATAERSAEPAEDPFVTAAKSGLPFRKARALLMEAFTASYVEDMLGRHKGNVTSAAEAAGVARRYFYQLKSGGD